MAQLPQMMRNAVQRVQRTLTKEQARALPTAKGGEEQLQLQTHRTEIYTYFTKIGGTELLYSAENWVQVTLQLEDAGPVAVGNAASLVPVLSGRGVLLDTSPAPPFVARLARGTRLYISSETINRVKVIIEPIPWLEQIDSDIGRVVQAIGAAAQAIIQGLVSGIAGSAAAAPTSSSGKTPAQIPCPPGDRARLPRLTPLTGPRKMR